MKVREVPMVVQAEIYERMRRSDMWASEIYRQVEHCRARTDTRNRNETGIIHRSMLPRRISGP